jgi:hypothetical protein
MKNKSGIFISHLILAGLITFLSFSCKRDKEIKAQVLGYEFLNKIPGLWHGPVSSTTSAGSFDAWYVDFRPVSAAQISQFSLLDTNTINNISFFIVKHNNQLKVAMRTEGCFKNSCCVTYEVIDSLDDITGYYRFSDFARGENRAYTEFKFNNEALVMKVYTTKFDSLHPAVLHSTWTATLGTRNNTSEAVSHFNYPQPVMIKDFSHAFDGMTESIYFDFTYDPYNSVTQPYVGSVTANISIDSSLTTSSSDKIFLLFTTEPLFNGTTYNADNLKYISKYVFLSVATSTYKIRNIHPGKYYVYPLIDRNHDNLYLTGDYMSSNFTNSFTVADKQDVNIYPVIDYIIP